MYCTTLKRVLAPKVRTLNLPMVKSSQKKTNTYDVLGINVN